MKTKRDPNNPRTWMIDTTITYPDGRHSHIQRRGFRTQGDAEGAYWSVYSQYLEKYGFKQLRQSIDELITNYLEWKSHKVKPTTLNNVKIMIRSHLSKLYRGQPLSTVYTAYSLEKFRHHVISAKCRQDWKNKILRLFLDISTYAYDRRIIDGEMYRLAKLNSESIHGQYDPPTEYHIWTKDQYRTFIDTFDDNDKYKPLFQWMFFSGARIGETCALQWKDYDSEKMRIWITKTASNRLSVGKAVITGTKTKAGTRYVYLSHDMNKRFLELRNVFGKDPEKFLFFGYDNPIGYNTILQKFKRHTIKAKLPKIKIHEIRHSNNTWLLNDNQSREDVDIITRRLGRSSLKVTLDTYYHSNPDIELKIVEKIKI